MCNEKGRLNWTENKALWTWKPSAKILHNKQQSGINMPKYSTPNNMLMHTHTQILYTTLSLSLSLSHTHTKIPYTTLSLSLSLTHTHKHTHRYSTPNNILTSFTHTHKHTYTHKCSTSNNTHSHTHMHTHKCCTSNSNLALKKQQQQLQTKQQSGLNTTCEM